MATKFEDLGKKLRLLSTEIGRIDVALIAATIAEGEFRDRVFDQVSKDINGNLLPQYSEEYLKYNKYGKQKQSSTWNLQATKSLSMSLNVVNKKGSAQLAIIGDEQIDKADGLEERSGKTIFELSDSEEKEVIRTTIKIVENNINKAINKIFK